MQKLGEGGEAEVFVIDDSRVLRRFRRADHPAIAGRVALAQEVAAGARGVDFLVPEILDVFDDDAGHPCFVERRLPGRSMTEALRDLSGRRREALLASYLSTAEAIRAIEFSRPWFGEVLPPDPLRAATWNEYLVSALDRQLAEADPRQYPELSDLEAIVANLRGVASSVPEPEPSLVHFDYFPGNVLCDDTRVLAVIDWSVLSIVGDPDLDLALAVGYFGVTPTSTAEDRVFGERWLAERGLEERATFYRRWGAAWWAPASFDEAIRRWVASVLGPGGETAHDSQ